MSVIGDALGRAERDYQAGHIQQKTHVPTRVSRKPATEPAETAVKGIARPRQSQTAGGGWFSNVLMVLFVAVIGFAGYMTVDPEWVDSLWKFPDLEPKAVATVSKTAAASIPTPVVQTAPPDDMPAAIDLPVSKMDAPFPVCPQVANAIDLPVEPIQTPPALEVGNVSPELAEPQTVPSEATVASTAKIVETASPKVRVPLQPTLPDSSADVEASPVVIPVANTAPIAVESPASPGERQTSLPVAIEKEKPTLKNKSRMGRRVGRKKLQEQPTRSLTRIPIQSNRLSDRFKVEGVMLGGERKSAVINGEIVGIDDEVDGAVVRAITDSGIAIEIDGRIRRVPVISKRKQDGPDQPMTETEFND
ncbi:MAG: hypothetical protein R3E58_11190 [Phycisphaerae bacterium]